MKKITLLVILTLAILIGVTVGIITFFEYKKMEKEELISNVVEEVSNTAEDLTITIVYDNNPYNEELETRWGFSCLIEGLEKTILFDVGGEGSVLLKNMEKLKIDPKKVNVIVLSHIHYDHIGGLSDFLKKNPLVF